jgi:WhiB family redox-sensing transcriptional regulator
VSLYPGVRSSWMDQAACSAPEHAPKFDVDTSGNRRVGRDAKAVCKSCPVITQCLAYALSWPIASGVWGGTDEYDRASLRSGRH